MIRGRVVPVIAWLILSSADVFAQIPSDAEIRKILADRVYAQNLGIGIVVGVIDAFSSMIQDLDEGGLIWAGESSYPGLDAAFRAAEAAVAR